VTLLFVLWAKIPVLAQEQNTVSPKGRLMPSNMVIAKKPVAGLSQSSLARFASRAARAVGLTGTPNVLLTTNAEMKSLNQRFRGKNSATDVLSFPPAHQLPANTAGDIAISTELAAKNAKRMGHAWAAEVKILTLHGVLHLAGYDHEHDNGTMARKEQTLRNYFRLPIGLIERSSSDQNGACEMTKRAAGKMRARHFAAPVAGRSRKKP